MMLRVIQVFNSRIAKSYNKIRTTWNIVNELLGKQHSLKNIQQLMVAGNCYTNQQDIADQFNRYFATIVDSSNSKKSGSPSNNNFLPYTYLQNIEYNQHVSMVFKSFSTKEIISIIKSLKSKDSFGYDEISQRILKLSANYISSPLTQICNKVMSSGNFPDRLKYSIVVPLFKKGNTTDPANYRPISMLTSLAKVLEMAMYMRLTEHISVSNLMTDQ